MTKSTLFSYTVEEDEGKLVLTLTGSLVANFIRQVTEDPQKGKGESLLAKLLPFESLQELISTSSDVQAAEEPSPLSLQDIFSQNIDQTFASFEEEMKELRDSMAEVGQFTSQGKQEAPKAKDV